MHDLIAPIQNLIIDENIVPCEIFKGTIFDNSFNQLEIIQLGAINYGKIVGQSIFHRRINQNEPPSDLEIHDACSNFNSNIIFGLWLVKDNSCFIHNIFMRNQISNTIMEQTHTVFTSNAKCEHTKVHFTTGEILAAFELTEKLSSILEYPDSFPLHSDFESFIIGNANMANYATLTRFVKTTLFLQHGRQSQSVLAKIGWYIVAIESLFTRDGEKNDLSFKLSYWVSHFLGENFDSRVFLHNTIRDGYSLRSSFLHGTNVAKLLKSREKQFEICSSLDEILRSLLLMIIKDDEMRNLLNHDKEFKSYFRDKLLY